MAKFLHEEAKISRSKLTLDLFLQTTKQYLTSNLMFQGILYAEFAWSNVAFALFPNSFASVVQPFRPI